MKNPFPFKFKSFKDNYTLLVVLSFGVLAMLPVFFFGIPVGADLDNHFRFALPFYDEIHAGNFFPAWLAESNNGFGDARFRFYPPFLYYLLCLFRWMTGDWYFATLFTFTFFSIIGAFGVYFWSRQSFSKQTSVIAALIFAFVPYHLTQFYQASLLAEFAATSLLPFAFMFVEKLTADNTRNLYKSLLNATGLAVSFALIVTTHLPTTVIGSFSLGIFALLLADWKARKKALLFCTVGIAFGLILSSWFWVKMLSELSWIQAAEKVSSAYYDYRNNFIFSPFSPSNLNTWYASFVAALTVGIFLPSLILLRRIFSKKPIEDLLEKHFAENADNTKRRLFAAVIIALISFLMTTDLSRPVWAIVPKLKDVQFPYRWLAITSVVICPIVALSLQIWRECLKRKNFRPVHLPLFLGFAAALFFSIDDLVINSEYLSHEKFVRRIEEARGARSFSDWLPPGASELKDLQPLNGQIDAGTRKIIVRDWQSHLRIFSVAAGEEPRARLRSYFYPLWKAYILKDGQRIQTATEQATDGTLLVTIPPDASEVEVVFTEPPRTKISFIIAALGWMFALVLLILAFLKVRTVKN